jgi:hypothetical protein
MNGNTFKQILVYDSVNDKMIWAGELSDNIALNKLKKTIDVNYEGSNYMEHYLEEYNWVGNKLHLTRDLEVSEELTGQPRRYYYRICKNPTSNDIKVIWQGTQGVIADDAKFDSLEQHFFDN